MARASTAAEGRPAPAHRAAVIGDPIAHSLSPLLHRAAYEGLGLADWSYEALQVAPGELAALVGSLRAGAQEGPVWAGLSVTMPHKQAIMPMLDVIDPLAQGAHAETDLAALSVFGQRHLDRIYAGYDEVSPLAAGWRERVGLHQLHMLIIHAFLFGASYGAETASVARRYA